MATSRQVFERDGWKCRHCKDRNGLHRHHVIYRSQGGEDDFNNSLTLCHQCHIVGIHGGFLEIEIIERLEHDIIVRFTRKKNWRPK